MKMKKTKMLFVCTANRDRSVTAEALYRGRLDLEVKSAGTWRYAKNPLTEALLQWADLIIVMEPAHKEHIRAHFPTFAAKEIHCLHIEDSYQAMDSELIKMIEERVDSLI